MRGPPFLWRSGRRKREKEENEREKKPVLFGVEGAFETPTPVFPLPTPLSLLPHHRHHRHHPFKLPIYRDFRISLRGPGKNADARRRSRDWAGYPHTSLHVWVAARAWFRFPFRRFLR